MNESFKRHFVFDVEADGQDPFQHNMIEFGIVNLYDTSKSFHGQVSPRILNDGGVEAARKVCGISWEEQLKFRDWRDVMHDASNWVRNTSNGQRAIFWSDNPAFDWQYWNSYVHSATDDNPAGFSCRRIGDLYAGMKGHIFNTNGWKKRRKTVHDHNPVNDARGNAEALISVLKEMNQYG